MRAIDSSRLGPVVPTGHTPKLGAAWFLLWGAAACGSQDPDTVPAVGDVETRSEPLCSLLGPYNEMPGLYGTDLGFTVPSTPERDAPLYVLFGDTWTEATNACQYAPEGHDDLIATLPARLPDRFRDQPIDGSTFSSCTVLQHALEDAADVSSWTRLRPFAEGDDRSDPENALAMGMMRTPVAAFRDANDVYAILHRNDPVPCDDSSDCPGDMVCGADLPATDVGVCQIPFGSSDGGAQAFCRTNTECLAAECVLDEDICLSQTPFKVETPDGTVTPSWYRDDPRRGAALTMYIARMVDDRKGDFVIEHRFQTQRFGNVTARAVARFDPDHPENNDYRPGFHTLLLWGRPAFVSTGGAQNLPFLLYQPLPAPGAGPLDWSPRFFAGYREDGRPRWSEREQDAQPIYGAEVKVGNGGAGSNLRWKEPEFDHVNQMSVSWIAPLRRWVMLYGGDVPDFAVLDPDTGTRIEPVYPQPTPGAIHMRLARHPWGGSGPGAAGAWTSPEPVLTRTEAAPYMVCSDDPQVAQEMPGCLPTGNPHTPADLLGALAGFALFQPDTFLEASAQCLEGQAASTAQSTVFSGSTIGRLYGASIIEPWTRKVSGGGADGAQTTVELYWNVSTWNPYQVVLVRTLLSAAP